VPSINPILFLCHVPCACLEGFVLNKEKSLGVNALLNCLKSVLSIIFPIITYPYVLRVLQVENIGKVDFSNSVVNYFVLLAGLGISTYAIREGAKLRDNKNQLESFSCEMFSINTISTVLSLLLLLICIFFSPTLQDYRTILIVQSFTLFGNLVGVVWLYSIVEDYTYIAIRALVVHVLALILMFVFVRDETDYVAYAAVSVVANAGANIFNFFHASKYIHLRFTFKVNLKQHIKPILIIFASSVASTIYVNSDKTILGLLSDDYHVGLYSASVNVYTVLKICMISLIQVLLPRLSNYVAHNKFSEYRSSATYIFRIFIVFLLPIVTGCFMISKDILLVVGGASYVDASTSLRILSLALVFSILATFYTNAVLLPFQEEQIVMKATVISALVNVLLNLVLLRNFQQNGAAFTTLLAELIMFLYQFCYGKRHFKLDVDFRFYASVLLGCVWIIASVWLVGRAVSSLAVRVILEVSLSAIGYFLSLILLKNDIAFYYLKKVRLVLTRH
jgi:O-antigen/teichoic acid export membrane protein